MTVRSLVVTTDKGNFRLLPTREVHSSSKEEEPKLTWRQKRAVKREDLSCLPPITEFGMLNWYSNPTAEGVATIDPFTSPDFLFFYRLFENDQSASPPSGFRITIEYEAWPGHRSILRWDIADRADDICRHFQELRDKMRCRSVGYGTPNRLPSRMRSSTHSSTVGQMMQSFAFTIMRPT